MAFNVVLPLYKFDMGDYVPLKALPEMRSLAVYLVFDSQLRHLTRGITRARCR